MAKDLNLDQLFIKAIRANAVANSITGPEAQKGARKKLAEIHALLSVDPKLLAEFTALAKQKCNGNFSWHIGSSW